MGSSGKEGPLGHHSHVQGDATAAKLVRVSVAAQHRAPCGAGLEAMVSGGPERGLQQLEQ